MAQSDDVTPTSNREFRRESLPEGEARLVIREDDVTVTFVGDEERVQQRFLEHLAEQMTVDEMEAAIDEYSMPASDEGLVPAEEFYDN